MQSPLFERNVPGMTDRLQAATVGIAGCGGLGSNVAVSLVRAGIGRLVLADFRYGGGFQSEPAALFSAGHRPAQGRGAQGPSAGHSPPRRRGGPCHAPQSRQCSLPLFPASISWSRPWTRPRPSNGSSRPGSPPAPRSPWSAATACLTWGIPRPSLCAAWAIWLSAGDGVTESDAGLCAPRVALVAHMEAHAVIGLLLGLETL